MFLTQFKYDGAEIIDKPVRGSISVTYIEDGSEQILHFFTMSPHVIRNLYRQCMEMDFIVKHEMN